MGAYADDPQLANALNRKQIMGGGGAQGNPGVGGGTQMSPPVYSNPVAPVRTPMPPQAGNDGGYDGTHNDGGYGGTQGRGPLGPPQGGGNGGGYPSDPVRYPGLDPRGPLGPPAVRKPRYTVPYSGTTKDTGSYVNPRSAGRPRGY